MGHLKDELNTKQKSHLYIYEDLLSTQQQRSTTEDELSARQKRYTTEDELRTKQKRYTRVRGITRGGFGTHDLCYDTYTKEHVVLKFIPRGDRVTKSLERSLVCHSGLKHPHIINVSQVFLLPSYLVIVLEFVQEGTLAEFLLENKRLTEERARWIFQQIAIAVDYLHFEGVSSRDIRPEHVLLSHGDSQAPLVKLTGFKLAKHERYHSMPRSYLGTIQYMAPEIIAAGGAMEYGGKPVDMWSLGVLLYFMIAGCFPFEVAGMDPKKILALQRQSFELPDDLQVTTELKHLLQGLLEPDANQRLTARDVLEHSWFLDNLPTGAAEYNEQKRKELADNPDLQNTKDMVAEHVKITVREARIASDALEHLWDDSEYVYHDDGYQLQSMDTEEFNIFSIECNCPEVPAAA